MRGDNGFGVNVKDFVMFIRHVTYQKSEKLGFSLMSLGGQEFSIFIYLFII